MPKFIQLLSLSILIIVSLAPFGTPSAAPLTLQDFLNRELSRNSAIREQVLATGESQLAVEASEQWWQTTLASSAIQARQSLLLPQSLNGAQDSLTLGVTAALRSGTSLQLFTQQNSGKKQPLTPDYLQSYRTVISQSLFFGAFERWTHHATLLQATARTLALQEELQRQCVQLTGQYLQALTLKKIHLLYESRQALAEELLRQMRQANKLGRASRLSLIQSEADVLVLQTQTIASRNERLKLTQIFNLGDLDTILEDPSSEIKTLSQLSEKNALEPAGIRKVQSLEASIAELAARQEATQAQALPDLNLQLEQAWYEGYQYLQDQRLSLNLTWRFDDPTPRRDLAIAVARKNHLEKSRALAIEDNTLARATDLKVIHNLESNDITLSRRLTLLREIEAEFRSRFLRGLIEFQSYSQVRDQMLTVEMELARNQQELTLKRLMRMELLGFDIPFCEVNK